MKPTKYQLHKSLAITMFADDSDIAATNDAEEICADLTYSPDGPLAGVMLLNRVIRYLNAGRDGLRVACGQQN
jgi:hypothetical protein